MKKFLTCSVAFSLALGLAANAQESLPGGQSQQVTAEEVQALVSECESCHGKNGVSQSDSIPSLAGKSADAIVESVEQFYFYERHCPNAKGGKKPKGGARNMCDVADRLTREEILAIGRYFEAL